MAWAGPADNARPTSFVKLLAAYAPDGLRDQHINRAFGSGGACVVDVRNRMVFQPALSGEPSMSLVWNPLNQRISW